MDVTWRDYVDAQDATTRAQNDARFAEVLARIDGLGVRIDGLNERIDAKIDGLNGRMEGFNGRIDGLNARIDGLPRPPSLGQIILVVASGLVGALGLTFTILAFAADRFDGGLSASGLLDAVVARQEARDAAQDAQFARILDELQALRATPPAPP